MDLIDFRAKALSLEVVLNHGLKAVVSRKNPEFCKELKNTKG
jgi:hypothetical protein